MNREILFRGKRVDNMRKLGLKSTLLATTHQVFEVVGNIFDNPELLKINNKLWSESV